MTAKKILIILYLAAFIGGIFLCSKMLSNIDRMSPQKIIYFKDAAGYIMAEPNENSMKLLELDKGDKLELVSEGDEWYKVINGPFEGYVKRKSISENPSKD